MQQGARLPAPKARAGRQRARAAVREPGEGGLRAITSLTPADGWGGGQWSGGARCVGGLGLLDLVVLSLLSEALLS